MAARSYTGIGTAPPASNPVVNEANFSTLIAQFDDASTGWTLNGDAAISSTNANADIGATNALQVDGTGDYATVAPPTSFARASGVPFTFEVWARTTVAHDDTANVGIVEYVGSGGNFSFLHRGVSGTSQVRFERNGSSVANAVQMTTNAWTHLAVAINASNFLGVFVNGTRVSTVTSQGAFGGTGTGTFYAGNINSAFGGNYFTGQLSGLRVVLGRELYDPTQTSLTVPTSLFKLQDYQNF